MEEGNIAIQDLIDNNPVMDNVTAQLVLNEAYDIGFGIFNHDHDSLWNPLSMVAVHEAEDVESYSRQEHLIRRFLMSKIHKQTGLSLTQFLELPRDMVSTVLDISREVKQDDDEYTQELLDELKGKGNG